MAGKVSVYKVVEHRTRSCMNAEFMGDVMIWGYSMGVFFLWWDPVLLFSFFCILFGSTFIVSFEEPSIEHVLGRAYPQAILSSGEPVANMYCLPLQSLRLALCVVRQETNVLMLVTQP